MAPYFHVRNPQYIRLLFAYGWRESIEDIATDGREDLLPLRQFPSP